MAYPTDLPRHIVIKARRDTAALVIGATAATFALANVIHAHHPAAALTHAAPPSGPPEQDWTGQLADVAATQEAAPIAPFTSASLVVPRSELALPRMPVRALVRLRGCEGSACVAKASVPTPQRRPLMIAERDVGIETVNSPVPASSFRTATKSDAGRTKPSLMSKINPLNHLPDISTIKRPIASAGDTVSSWFRRF